jgi:hypothetical protein
MFPKKNKKLNKFGYFLMKKREILPKKRISATFGQFFMQKKTTNWHVLVLILFFQTSKIPY